MAGHKPTLLGTVKIDPLLPKIENALEIHKISVTKFGYLVAGDPALVPKMRGGRVLRSELRQKVEKALARIAKEGSL